MDNNDDIYYKNHIDNPFDEIDDNDFMLHSPREEQQRQSHNTGPTFGDGAFKIEENNKLPSVSGEVQELKSNDCEREHLLKNATISIEE